MCTLTYLPLDDGGFIFTTNRDERVQRPALPPAHYQHGKLSLLYPKDLAGSGSWVITDGLTMSVCLLNGAFKPHERKSSYRISRGVALIDLFEYRRVMDYVCDYSFRDIEPFTLVVLEHGMVLKINEIRWDGESIHYRQLPGNTARIWSSVTLYSPEIRQERENWFSDWISCTSQIDISSVLAFHRKGGRGDPWVDLIMHRNGELRTVSITSLLWSKGSIYMYYDDLLLSKQYFKRYGQERFISL